MSRFDVNLETQIFFTDWGWFFFFGNSTDARGKLVINGVKLGGYMWPEHWLFLGCYTGVDIICILDVRHILNCGTVFISNWYDIIVRVKLVVYYEWFAKDDNEGFLSVGVDTFDWLYLK